MDETYSFADIAHECYARSTRWWLQEHRGYRSNEEMLASHQLNTEVVLIRADRVNDIKVIVTIRGMRATPSETYFFKFRRTHESAWVEVVPPTSSR